MPDRSMAEFIREHLSQFSPEELRQNLISAGNDPAEVDAAFAEALRAGKPQPPPLLTAKFAAMILICTLGTVAIVTWALKSVGEKRAAPEAVTAEIPEEPEEKIARLKAESLERFEPKGEEEPGVYTHAAGHGLVRVPAGFVVAPPLRNPDIRYHFGFKASTAPLEVRIQFAELVNRPRRKGDAYRENFDEPSPSWGQALQRSMNSLARVKFSALNDELARGALAADWGYVSEPFGLDPRKKFNGDYKLGLVAIIHRNGVGTYSSIVLADDYPTLKNVDIVTLMRATRFTPAAKAP